MSIFFSGCTNQFQVLYFFHSPAYDQICCNISFPHKVELVLNWCMSVVIHNTNPGSSTVSLLELAERKLWIPTACVQ